MQVTEVRLTNAPQGSQIAFGSVTLDDAFVIMGIKLMRGQRGMFVSMPQKKTKDKNGSEKWMDICFPKSKQLRQAIQEAVIANHNQYPQGSGSYGQPVTPAPYPNNTPPQQTNVFPPAPEYNLVWGPVAQGQGYSYQQAIATPEFIQAWNTNPEGMKAQGYNYMPETPQGNLAFKKV